MKKLWILGGIAGLVLGCWRQADTHCANNEGDLSCADGLFCDRCNAANDGCVTARPTGSDEFGECYSPDPDSSDVGEGPTTTTTNGPGTLDTTASGSMSGTMSGTLSVTDSDDPTGETTDDNGCVADGDCMSADAPFCDPDGICVPCNAMPEPNAACESADSAAPVCNDGQCVQCTDNNAAACADQTPICGPANICLPCTEHAHCPDSACHLDGSDQGACFNGSDVVTASNAAQLESAFAAASADDDVVIQLTGTNYTNVSIDFVTNAEVALIGDGAQDISGNTSGGIIGLGGSAIVYLADLSVAGNISGDGLNCSGTALWLDDTEVRNNAQLGLDISGGCALHLRRSTVRVNNGGGIDQVGSQLELTNSVVALNGGSVSPFGGLSVDGAELLITYSTLAGNDSQNIGMTIRCSGANSGEVRNSIIAGEEANSVDPCAGLTFVTNGVDDTGLGAMNDNIGAFNPAWFANPATGDFGLASTGETELVNIAEWQDGDPLTDVDGDDIPTDMPSFPGYDQP